jgi:hypothetical protein
MRVVLGAAVAVAVFATLSWAAPAAPDSPNPPTPLFASNDVLRLTIKGPVGRMSRDADAKPMPGQLTVVGGGTPETLPIELSTRGITRRRSDVCQFPPLRVDFTEKKAPNSIFKGQNNLKLVTHCRNPENFQQYVLLEYAAYRLYNALTPDSFRARLAMIDYVGDDGRAITTRYGFFIEDIDDAARRNDQRRLRDVNRVLIRQLDPVASARFAMFEYMIGNLDWAMQAGPAGEDCCHNARLVGVRTATAPTEPFIPVPYDFDFSGFVNAPYAEPPPVVKVPNVRVRYYRGLCIHNEQAQAVAADLLTRRATLLAVLDEIPQLDRTPRQRVVTYLNEFFDRIGSPAQVAEVIKTCLGPRD